MLLKNQHFSCLFLPLAPKLSLTSAATWQKTLITKADKKIKYFESKFLFKKFYFLYPKNLSLASSIILANSI